jgi:hypothetical protein
MYAFKTVLELCDPLKAEVIEFKLKRRIPGLI